MARRILSEETIANEIYEKFGKIKLKEAWHKHISKNMNDGISNIEDYIVKCRPQLTQWLEILIPYAPSFSTIDDIISDYFRGEYYKEDLSA